MKILIVEDNPEMRDLLALRVPLTGYIPILASHGKEGVEKANAEKPDLILMDMMMPVMYGWQAVRALRASRERRTYPYWQQLQSFVLRISRRVWTRAVTATSSSRLNCGSPAQNQEML